MTKPIADLAIHCEAKKHAYRQTQDGVVVSFVLHPQEVPEGLAVAPLGARYVLALVELNDDETPKEASKPSAREPQPVTDKPRAGAKRWGDMQPAQQAGIRCGEPLFLAFLKEERPDDWHDASEDPAECVRMICRVESRSLLNREEAAQRWQKLNDQFVAWERVGA